MNRFTMYGLIHKGAKRLFGDDDETYRHWLNSQTGKRSCKEMTIEQLSRLVDNLRDMGALDGKARGGKGYVGQPDRPTSKQWATLAGLARERGWHGLEDKRLKGFVTRTTGLETTRFLTRKTISDCITGLTKWNQTSGS